jgi:outer membrane lipoprotein-sorting protein
MISGSSLRPTLRTILCVLPVIAVACGAAQAEMPAVTWDLERLMQGMRRVKTARATFVERKYLGIVNGPLESTGTLRYDAPDRLEKHTVLPAPESLVLAGDELTITNEAKHQRRTLALQAYPTVWAFVESIRSTLAGDLPTLRRFYRIELEGGADRWRLVLKPSDASMQAAVSEIRIVGSGNRISTVEVIVPEGDRSVMTITEEGR